MAAIRVASGNFIEMYDFMAFGYFAMAIGLVSTAVAERMKRG